MVEISFDTGINNGFKELGQLWYDRNRSVVGNIRVITSLEDGCDRIGFPLIQQLQSKRAKMPSRPLELFFFKMQVQKGCLKD